MIDVVKEQVESLDALEQSRFECVPFLGRHGTRYQVERKYLLDASPIGVDREGDALVDENPIGVLSSFLEAALAQVAQPFGEGATMGVRLPGGAEQFVPRRRVRLVVLK